LIKNSAVKEAKLDKVCFFLYKKNSAIYAKDTHIKVQLMFILHIKRTRKKEKNQTKAKKTFSFISKMKSFEKVIFLVK